MLGMKLAQCLTHSKYMIIVNYDYYYSIICTRVNVSCNGIYKTGNTLAEEKVHIHK